MNVQKQWVAERRHCILFVDDEPGMLKAFERLLHPERHRWEMGIDMNSFLRPSGGTR